MVEPMLRTPAPDSALSGDDVSLADETGRHLARRFSGTTPPGTANRDGDRLEWSVSPGDWTVTGTPGREDVDMTHVRAVFRISGHVAPAVLAKVCWLDLSDDMFPNGAAGRTILAGVATEIVRDDADGMTSFLLLPSRSFGAYLWDVLLDAGLEFGWEDQ